MLGLAWGLGLALWPCDATARGAARPAQSAQSRTIEAVRKAVQAFHAGDYATSRKLLGPLADRGLATLRSRDYALFVLGESEALLGDELGDAAGRRMWQSAAAHLREVEKVPGTALGPLARVRAADCLSKLATDGKQDAEIGTSYKAALTAGRSDTDAAVVRFHLGEIAGRAGRKPEARELWRRIYVDHPLHPMAERALARLHELDAEVKLDANEHIARARNLIQGRRWPEAIAELASLPKDLGPALRDEAEYWLGTSMYRMRRNYGTAAEKLLGVAPRMKGERQVDAMFHGARALSRADKDDDAILSYQAVVKAHPKSHFAPEASFLVGWLDWNRSRYPEAITSLQDTVKRFSGPFAEEARWYIGLSRYFLKDYAAALTDFEILTHRPGMTGQKGSYWAGVAELRMAQKDAAVSRWRKLVESHPLTYYALLARLRLREQGVNIGPFGDAAQTADGLPPWSDGVKDKSGKIDRDTEQLRADPRLLRVEELIAFELLPEAGQELRRVESGLLQDHGGVKALPELTRVYSRAQNFQRPHLLADSYGVAALKRDPHRVPEARPFWEAKYPLAYRPLVESYAPTGENPPRYLYAIMQKESAYNPHDVSFADAIGLLQMIPPTSRKVARHVGRPYTDDVLYDPEGNIQFGAWYIGHLLKKFKGQVALGAGSFNAGPAAMVRFLSRNGTRPLDEFIELCPYRETREYMKKLLDIYAHYVYLWDKQEYLPELTIDTAYLKDDGIDY